MLSTHDQLLVALATLALLSAMVGGLYQIYRLGEKFGSGDLVAALRATKKLFWYCIVFGILQTIFFAHMPLFWIVLAIFAAHEWHWISRKMSP